MYSYSMRNIGSICCSEKVKKQRIIFPQFSKFLEDRIDNEVTIVNKYDRSPCNQPNYLVIKSIVFSSNIDIFVKALLNSFILE